MKKILTSFLVLMHLIACQQNTNIDDTAAPAHDHGSLPVLIFNDGMELFAEADQLFESHEVKIRAHLTFLEGYLPAKNGDFYARLAKSGTDSKWIPLKLSQPGIFVGNVTPSFSGEGNFDFKYLEDTIEVTFSLNPIRVFTHDEEPPEIEHVEGEIFTKEQAWQTEFALLALKLDTFVEAIHCGGKIISSASSMTKVASPARGKVVFVEQKTMVGQPVSKGDALFLIRSEGVGEESLDVQLAILQTNLELAEENFSRKKELANLGAVSKRDLEEAENQFIIAKSKHESFSNHLSGDAIVVRSSQSGVISSISVKEGEYVDMGDVLMQLTSNKTQILQVNAPATLGNQIQSFTSAHIQFPEENIARSIDYYKGELVGAAPEIPDGSGFLPVFFSGEYSRISGSYVDVWLLSQSESPALLIPKTALIEEYGKYSVYVQVEGESYAKRTVEIGGYDGANYQVLKGLNDGDVIISLGAMAVKVANSLGAPPAHSH